MRGAVGHFDVVQIVPVLAFDGLFVGDSTSYPVMESWSWWRMYKERTYKVYKLLIIKSIVAHKTKSLTKSETKLGTDCAYKCMRSCGALRHRCGYFPPGYILCFKEI
jgi:hypothetical protein